MQPDIHGINTAGYSDDFSALAGLRFLLCRPSFEGTR